MEVLTSYFKGSTDRVITAGGNRTYGWLSKTELHNFNVKWIKKMKCLI